MAKAKVKHLDEAIDRLFKRYESNLRKAMQTARCPQARICHPN